MQAAVQSNEAPLLPIIPCRLVSGTCAALKRVVTNLLQGTFRRHLRKLLYLLCVTQQAHSSLKDTPSCAFLYRPMQH